MIDLFNTHALEAANAHIKELEQQTENIKFVKQESTCISFYIDNEMKIRIESKVNKDLGNTLVNEGYLDEHQVEDSEAHHLAYILIINEVTNQMISQYEGEPVDAREARADKPA